MEEVNKERVEPVSRTVSLILGTCAYFFICRKPYSFQNSRDTFV